MPDSRYFRWAVFAVAAAVGVPYAWWDLRQAWLDQAPCERRDRAELAAAYPELQPLRHTIDHTGDAYTGTGGDAEINAWMARADAAEQEFLRECQYLVVERGWPPR